MADTAQKSWKRRETSHTTTGHKDEWRILWGLFTQQEQQHQEQLCQDLLHLPAANVNQYLLQYVYLAVSRPSGPLERAIIELCGRSFNTAVQVSWLLLALLQDQPGNQHIRQFKDACEVAALLGGKPSHPHYLQISQHPQQSPIAVQQQPWPADVATAIPIQTSITGPANTAGATSSHGTTASSNNSRASTPFAAVVGDKAAFNSSPQSSPSAAAAAIAASSLISASSMSSSYRFRDSLDFELMRQTSHQDLFAATAAAVAAGSGTSAAAGSRPSSPSRAVQQLQHQQNRQPGALQQPAVLSTPPKGLPPIRTNSNSGNGSSSVTALNRRYNSSSPRLAPSPRKARQSKVPLGWAIPGSVAAAYGTFEDYLAARKQQLVGELGEGEGVSGLMAASHAVEPQGVGWLMTHEEEPLSASLLLSMPPRSPRHAAGRDSYLATLDFVAALCETSSSLTRFPPENRRKVLRQCLSRISQEVEYAAEQGVAVRYPIGGCESRVLRLLVNEAAILNSRDKAPFLLLMEVQRDLDFVDEVSPEPILLLEPFTAAAAAAADASCQPQPTAGGTETDISLPGLNLQQQQQQQRTQSSQAGSPTKAAAAAAQQHLHHHLQQQQQQHSGWQRDSGTIGRSPLSRGASPIPITSHGAAAAAAGTAAAMSAPTDLAAAAAQGLQPPPAAAAAAVQRADSINLLESTMPTGQDVSQLCKPAQVGFANSAAVLQDIPSAAAAPHTSCIQQHSNPPTRRSLDQQYQRQQQQQQQQDLKSRFPSNLRRSFDQLRGSTAAAAGSTGSSSSRSLTTSTQGFRESLYPGLGTQRSAAAAAAAVRPPTALEQQMQEAAARLRGDATISVIKLHLRVLESGAAAAAAEGDSSSRMWSRHWSPPRRQQQQNSEAKANGRLEQINSSSTSHSAQLTADRVESPSAEGPWLFGEFPAESLSNSLILDSSAAAAFPSSSSNNIPTAQGNSSAAAAAAGPVAVLIEVLGAPPVVQHLSAAPQTQPRRRGRRLPSVEAIDIIAGKLGSAVPPPTEIGPPLRLSISSSSSSSIGENDPTDQDLSFVTSPVSTAASSDVKQQQQQQWVSIAGRSGDCGSDTVGEVNGTTAAAAAAAAAAGTASEAAAAAEDSPSSSTLVAAGDDCSSSSSKETAAAAAVADSALHQNQQQQPASSGWWGFLRNPLGRQQQQQPNMPTQQQQQQPSGISQQQQQQQQVDDKADHEHTAESVAADRARKASAVYGERWSTRTARVRSSSAYSSKPGWDLAGLIVKSGDDCRQELLALQLITEFGNIWAEAGLPLWVNPFEVLVTSNNTALIELIPDATSIHSIKARSTAATAAIPASGVGGNSEAAAESGRTAAAAAGSSGSVSLSDHFFAKWRRGSAECVAAQRRFVESLAAYSLVTYLLQVKDRHNGNIMLDDLGHIIHIDFGFMLSNAPGGNWVRFEAAPFKLTREMLEVMDTDTDGQPSELFDYFKVLCIQGFLVARRETQRIVSLVRIMAECSNPGSLHPHGSSSSAAGSCRKRTRKHARTSSSSSSSGSSSPTKALSDLEYRWQGSPTAVAAGNAAATSVGVAAVAVGVNGPAWPCFRAGPSRVVNALESRFALHLTDTACVQHVLRLIGDSLDAWSTRQYDYYQRVLNGIL